MRSFTVFTAIILVLLILTKPASAQDSLQYGPDLQTYNYDRNQELNLVYIGASWCQPCLEESLKQTLEELKIALYKVAESHNMNYSVIGVANDESLNDGWNFLQSSGYFDEIIIGKNWLNTGSIEFILKHEDILPGVPQIVVFKREIMFDEKTHVGEKEILVRKIGQKQMDKWIQNGISIDID